MDYYRTLMSNLEDATATPADRLLKLFSILEQAPESTWPAAEQQALLQQMTRLAELAQTDAPDNLARQLLLMAAEAKRQQLAAPGSRAMHHGRIAAKALITAQRKQHFRRNSQVYAMAASAFLVFGIGGMLLSGTTSSPSSMPLQTQAALQRAAPQSETLRQSAGNQHAALPARIEPAISPQRLSDMIAQRERMRQGTCIFPEALMLAEADRSIYLKHVVHGDITSDYREQEVANRLMQTVRCDYSPMLMKNSVG